VNGALFFVADQYASYGSLECLWVTDGTEAGTVLLAGKTPSWRTGPDRLTAVDDTLFFQRSGDLWKSDGTQAGTVEVLDVSGLSLDHLTAVDGVLYFSAHKSGHGLELWRSDGTAAGTTMVKDIRPGSPSGDPADLTAANGTLFFAAAMSFNDAGLWKSDGTESGTVLVKDTPGSPAGLTWVKDTLFFRAGSVGGFGLWKSNGTETSTVAVKDLAPYNLAAVGDTLFFKADDNGVGDELWKSNGTEAGTVLVKDVNPLQNCGYSGDGPCDSDPSALTDVDGTLFFVADDGVHGQELWVSDGTAEGTRLVQDLNPLVTCDTRGDNPGSGSHPCDSEPEHLANVNGTLYFAANDGTHGYELWKSDGTPEGTTLVKDIRPGGPGAGPAYVTAAGGSRFFFSAYDDSHGRELWAYDPDAPPLTYVYLPLVVSD
jgi:ELWxxDGT repeat protein